MMIAGSTILVLEDEAIVGLELEDEIAGAGGTALLVDRIDHALDLAVGSAIDGAILDVNVHGRESYPVADVLLRRGLPFIFATGYGDKLHPERFTAVPTVSKPYSLADIQQALIKASERPG